MHFFVYIPVTTPCQVMGLGYATIKNELMWAEKSQREKQIGILRKRVYYTSRYIYDTSRGIDRDVYKGYLRQPRYDPQNRELGPSHTGVPNQEKSQGTLCNVQHRCTRSRYS